jgi:thiamine transport system substrate-binding protein
VLRGTNPVRRAPSDRLLSPEVQADVPLSMFVFPAVGGTPLPEVFDQWAARPIAPPTLDPARSTPAAPTGSTRGTGDVR